MKSDLFLLQKNNIKNIWRNMNFRKLNNYTSCTLNFRLYRNESINYYYSQGKSFMKREGNSPLQQFKIYLSNHILIDNI